MKYPNGVPLFAIASPAAVTANEIKAFDQGPFQTMGEALACSAEDDSVICRLPEHTRLAFRSSGKWLGKMYDEREPYGYRVVQLVPDESAQEKEMKNEWPTIRPEIFDSNERAYPFIDGFADRDDMDTPARGFVTVGKQSVTFVGQRGPIAEVGVNGCQIDDMIKFARHTLEVFNKKLPCRENSIAITKLQEAEMWLAERTSRRSQRGIEGTNRP